MNYTAVSYHPYIATVGTAGITSDLQLSQYSIVR